MSKKIVRKKAAGKSAARKKKTASKKAASQRTVRRKTASKKTASKRTASKKTASKKRVAKKATYMPAPFRSVTPHIVVADGAVAIDFYKRAFGAVERFRMPTADGKRLMHAEIMVGDSVIMLMDESPSMDCKSPKILGGTTVYMYLYVPDVDAAYRQAVAAGAEGTMPPADMFWGDRFGQVTDPFGHKWQIATHLRDPGPAEIAAGAAAMGRQS